MRELDAAVAALSVAERTWLIGITVMAVSSLILGICLLNAVMAVERDDAPPQS